MPKEKRYKEFRRESERRRVDQPSASSNNGAEFSAADVAAEVGIGEHELLEFANYLGVDSGAESFLLPIVAEAITAPLPEEWEEIEDPSSGQSYFFNSNTQRTTWDHPLDQYFKNLIFVERKSQKAKGAAGGGGGGKSERSRRGSGKSGRVTAAPADARDELSQPSPRALSTTHAQAHALKSHYERELAQKQEELEALRGVVLEKSAQGQMVEAMRKGNDVQGLKQQNQKLQKELKQLRKADGKNAGLLGKLTGKGSAAKVQAELIDEQAIQKIVQHTLQSQGVAPTGAAMPKKRLRELRVEAKGISAGLGSVRKEVVIWREASTKALQDIGVELVTSMERMSAEGGAVAAPVGGALDGSKLQMAKAEKRMLEQQLEDKDRRLRDMQREISQLQERAAAGGGGGGGGGGAAGGGDDGAKAAAGAAPSSAELDGQRMAFDIERSALVADNNALTERAAGVEAALADAQREAASQAQLLTASQAEAVRVTDELAQSTGELAASRSQADGQLGAQQEEAVSRTRALSEEIAALKAEATALKLATEQAEAGKTVAEEAMAKQKSQLSQREAKAAQECERMFKLVQQAHEKVKGKEEDFRQRLVVEKRRAQQAAEERMGDLLKEVQAKYETENALRRSLFNQVQELKGNIRVYCRVRPFSSAETEEGVLPGIQFSGDHDDVIVTNPKNSMAQAADKKFEFEHTFKPDATQGAVFEEVKGLVTSVLDGYNVCIFAYGQTGSGKTYTMEGPAEDRGIYYNSVRELFAVVESRRHFVSTSIAVSLLEIYNEQIRDLLSDKQGQNLEIRRGPQGVFVPGLTSFAVQSADEVIEILAKGNEHRAVASTKMNENSSRSHSLLIVNCSSQRRGDNPRSFGSQLTLVDLAGSERLSKSQAEGKARLEAQHINKSLSALADVIEAAGKKAAHIPYRNSKLTGLLQESLGGDSKTLMLVHARPTAENVSETLCTLNFASRVRNVETNSISGKPSPRGGK